MPDATTRPPTSGPRKRCWLSYLPAQLSDDELAALVAAAITETGASGPGGMGQVMKVVAPQVAGRADGSRVAAMVKSRLAAG